MKEQLAGNWTFASAVNTRADRIGDHQIFDMLEGSQQGENEDVVVEPKMLIGINLASLATPLRGEPEARLPKAMPAT